jgi:hypothetical protein
MHFRILHPAAFPANSFSRDKKIAGAKRHLAAAGGCRGPAAATGLSRWFLVLVCAEAIESVKSRNCDADRK